MIKYFLFIFLFICSLNNLQAQGFIFVSEFFNEDTRKMSGDFNGFSTKQGFWYHYSEIEKDKIGEFFVWIRIISISSNGNETVYDTYKFDTDPDWIMFWEQLFLPIGKYKIKIYNEAKKELASSYEFDVNKY